MVEEISFSLSFGGDNMAQFFPLCHSSAFPDFLLGSSVIMVQSGAYVTTAPDISQKRFVCMPLCLKENSHRLSPTRGWSTEQLFREGANHQEHKKWNKEKNNGDKSFMFPTNKS